MLCINQTGDDMTMATMTISTKTTAMMVVVMVTATVVAAVRLQPTTEHDIGELQQKKQVSIFTYHH